MSIVTAARPRPDAAELDALTRKLRDDYGERAVVSRAIREQHAHGEGLADAGVPDIVVFTHTN